VRATFCQRAATAARSTCSSSWATESGLRSALPYDARSRRSHPSTDRECDSRTPLAGCEFFLFQSRFRSLTPSGDPEGKIWRHEAGRNLLCVARTLVSASFVPAARTRVSAPHFYLTISLIVPA